MNEVEIITKIKDAIKKDKKMQKTFCMPVLDGVEVKTEDLANGTIGTIHEKHVIQVSAEITLIVEHEWWDSSLTFQMRPDKNRVTISGGSLEEPIIEVWEEDH